MNRGLYGKGYPKEILNLSWQDWTPEIAELVRQHFLGPLSQNPHWKDISLGGMVREIHRMRTVTPEEWHLIEQAISYSNYLKATKSSSTAAPPPAARLGASE